MNIVVFLIFIFNNLFAQLIIPADPYGLLKHEQMIYLEDKNILSQTILRPNFYNTNNLWSLKIRSEIFYNNGAPNLENMSNRIIGRGIGLFTGINFSYSGKLFNFSIEPFYFTSQNNNIEKINRDMFFAHLNDVRFDNNTPYSIAGFRETQLYITYQGFGLGFSNANMWWGPGLHSSLTMTNNTSGFPHLMIGTINHKIYRNIRYNFRYVFTQLDKTDNNPYYTAFVGTIQFVTEPIITIGFNRNILSPRIINNKEISKFEAATIIFYSPDKIENTYQILATYFILEFPKSGLKIFFEFGTTDKWQNFSDLLNYPDHGIGSIIGFRQYGPFNNQNLIMGFEYARLAQSSFWDKRPTPNWYGNQLFDYSSYDGYRWAAHSGSDSDDLYIYFGYQSNKWSFVPAFNYERHGLLYSRPAEVKMEVRLDFRYNWKDYQFNVFFEREWLEHVGFVPNKWRIGNVLWFGIERDLTHMFSDKI